MRKAKLDQAVSKCLTAKSEKEEVSDLDNTSATTWQTDVLSSSRNILHTDGLFINILDICCQINLEDDEAECITRYPSDLTVNVLSEQVSSSF